MATTRIDTNKFGRFSARFCYAGDGIGAIAFYVVAIVGGFTSLLFSLADGPGTFFYVTLAVAVVLFAAIMKMEKAARLCVIPGTSMASMSREATRKYFSLNQENRLVAKPVVEWIYKHEGRTDSSGHCIYSKPCRDRITLIEDLLDEQVNQERLMLAQDDGYDKQSLEEYISILKEAREMHEKISEELVPNQPKRMVGRRLV